MRSPRPQSSTLGKTLTITQFNPSSVNQQTADKGLKNTVASAETRSELFITWRVCDVFVAAYMSTHQCLDLCFTWIFVRLFMYWTRYERWKLIRKWGSTRICFYQTSKLELFNPKATTLALLQFDNFSFRISLPLQIDIISCCGSSILSYFVATGSNPWTSWAK